MLAPGGPGSAFVVGRDTRRSSTMLSAALAAGLAAEGVHVHDLGVAPTPAAAWMADRHRWAAAVVSASHNAFADNGVKFFSVGGTKLSDEEEERLEAELARVLPVGAPDPADALTGADVGQVTPLDLDDYVDARGAPPGRHRGLHVVLDGANGAASVVAPMVFRRAGAQVSAIHCDPDGLNINDRCGSTDPGDLQRAVVGLGADVGFAFDGDADRVVAVDARGALVDGDQMIALCAVDRKARGELPDDTVVVTVMANLGFREAMAAHGIRVEETAVGDRHVLERMEQGGWWLGGEQSGHVIFGDRATTGDGLLTALEVLDVMARTSRPLADLAAVMTRRPQVLRNVEVADRNGLAAAGDLWAEVRKVEAWLGDTGRVLVRPSGTEPVVRVMVEAHTPEDAEQACATLCAAVTRSLGRPQRPGSDPA